MQAGSSQLLTGGVSTRTFAIPAPGEHKGAPPVPLFAQYVANWLDGLEGLVLPSTVEVYAGRLERHVMPRLAGRRLDEIGVDDILTLISGLRKQGYSGTTIAVTLTPLSRLFTHAVRRGLIEVNPVSKLDRSERPRVARHKRPVLNPEEIGPPPGGATPLPNSPRHRHPQRPPPRRTPRPPLARH